MRSKKVLLNNNNKLKSITKFKSKRSSSRKKSNIQKELLRLKPRVRSETKKVPVGMKVVRLTLVLLSIGLFRTSSLFKLCIKMEKIQQEKTKW